jgi:hypothetical protein
MNSADPSRVPLLSFQVVEFRDLMKQTDDPELATYVDPFSKGFTYIVMHLELFKTVVTLDIRTGAHPEERDWAC